MAGQAFNCIVCGERCRVPGGSEGDRPASRGLRERAGCLVAGGLLIVIAWLLLWPVIERGGRASARRPAEDLARVGRALRAYARRYGGYFPYDPRGPLYSLALLYPEWLPDPAVFGGASPGRGVPFPDESALAGRSCAYGYDSELGRDRRGPFVPVMAESLEHGGEGRYVLFADGHVEFRWETTSPGQPADDLFAPEPGWGADTDAYIRQ